MWRCNMKRCLGCMELIAEDGKCPKCGFSPEEYHVNPRCLNLNTQLNSRYVVGRVLGEGGFGITYIGWDSVLEFPVAIKEYFPANVALRDSSKGPAIYVYEGKSGQAYKEGLDRCIKEVKSLSKFHDLNGVVSIHDFFYANGTAYIIMEYLRGITLKAYVKKHGKMRPEQVFILMKPILRSLAAMHRTGMIHRDISPDNIMVTVDGKVKLIDFGAARISDDTEKSYTIFLKKGYTPEEQYRSDGEQGPWTDVYAVCGTMYYMITGETPPESLSRMIEDTLQDFSKFGISFSKRQQNALLKGMKVRHQDRYSTIGYLYQELYGEKLEMISDTTIGTGAAAGVDLENVLRTGNILEQNQQEIARVLNHTTTPKKNYAKQQGKQVIEVWNKVNIKAKLAAGVVVLGLIAAICAAVLPKGKTEEQKQAKVSSETTTAPNAPQETAVPKNEETAAPAEKLKMVRLIGKTGTEAEKLIRNMGDNTLKIVTKNEYSEKTKKGRVISQSIKEGTEYIKGTKKEIILKVSKGEKLVTVPSVLGKQKEIAMRIIHKSGLKYQIKRYTYSNIYARGEVMSQSLSVGRKVKKNKTIKIVVSLGPETVVAEPTPKPHVTPRVTARSQPKAATPKTVQPKATKRPNPFG